MARGGMVASAATGANQDAKEPKAPMGVMAAMAAPAGNRRPGEMGWTVASDQRDARERCQPAMVQSGGDYCSPPVTGEGAGSGGTGGGGGAGGSGSGKHRSRWTAELLDRRAPNGRRRGRHLHRGIRHHIRFERGLRAWFPATSQIVPSSCPWRNSRRSRCCGPTTSRSWKPETLQQPGSAWRHPHLEKVDVACG
ncbi:hypothetical protein F2981_31500 (plasmid) [Sinorhizobium meliloti]|nr:hypothetical protein [Sinorhizobium meliloti]